MRTTIEYFLSKLIELPLHDLVQSAYFFMVIMQWCKSRNEDSRQSNTNLFHRANLSYKCSSISSITRCTMHPPQKKPCIFVWGTVQYICIASWSSFAVNHGRAYLYTLELHYSIYNVLLLRNTKHLCLALRDFWSIKIHV